MASDLERLLDQAMAHPNRPGVSLRCERQPWWPPTTSCLEAARLLDSLQEGAVLVHWRRLFTAPDTRQAMSVMAATHDYMTSPSRALTAEMLHLYIVEPDPSLDEHVMTTLNQHGEVVLLELLTDLVRNGSDTHAAGAAYASYGAGGHSRAAREDGPRDARADKAWEGYACAIIDRMLNPKSSARVVRACDYGFALVGRHAPRDERHARALSAYEGRLGL